VRATGCEFYVHIIEQTDKNKKDDPMHEVPTIWGLGRVDICSLFPVRRKAVSRI